MSVTHECVQSRLQADLLPADSCFFIKAFYVTVFYCLCGILCAKNFFLSLQFIKGRFNRNSLKPNSLRRLQPIGSLFLKIFSSYLRNASPRGSSGFQIRFNHNISLLPAAHRLLDAFDYRRRALNVSNPVSPSLSNCDTAIIVG